MSPEQRWSIVVLLEEMRKKLQRVQQLQIGGASVSEVAEYIGFDYPQHFTRQFKKHFGITPLDYIKI